MKNIHSSLFFTFISLCSSVHAEDLGSYGQIYNKGKDGSAQIQDLMRQKQKNGELDQFWANYRNKTLNQIMHPDSLNMPVSYKSQQELRELKFTLPQDYRDQNGQVIASKGTVIEPLKISPLTQGLIFIDGTDQSQVDYAIKLGRKQPFKIVLTAGSPYDLRVKYQGESWQGAKSIPFYFDQRKMIIDSLNKLYGVNITTVPVALSQQGSKLLLQYGIN